MSELLDRKTRKNSLDFSRGMIFGILLFLTWSETALAETLKTKNFIIDITSNCSEGEVVCDDVSYKGRRISTGESISLTGRTLYRTCADRVTPCQFLGYEFLNGVYRYVVTESGVLKVYRRGKLILEEKGSWTN